MKCIQLLMSDDRTDPNIKPDFNIFRDTPLMHAVKCKYVEIVELLLRDKRTEPNVKDNAYGNTPMMHAVKKNQVDCVKGRVDLDCGDTAQSHPELAKLVEEEKLRLKEKA